MTEQAALNTSALGNSVQVRPQDRGAAFRILWPSLRSLYGGQDQAPPPGSVIITSRALVQEPAPAAPLGGSLWFLRADLGTGGSSMTVDVDIGQAVPFACDVVTVDLICAPLPDPSWVLPTLQQITALSRPGTAAAKRPTRSLALVAPVVPGPASAILTGVVPPLARDFFVQSSNTLGDAVFYFATTTIRFLAAGGSVVGEYIGTDLRLALLTGTPQSVPARAERWEISIAPPGGLPTPGWLEFGLAL